MLGAISLVPVVVIAVLVGVLWASVLGGLWSQKSERLRDSDGVTYRVQLGPTGVPWITRTNYDGMQVVAPFFWIRYLLHHNKTWTVRVTVAHFWRQKPALLEEEFSQREAAVERFITVMADILGGAIPGSQGPPVTET